MLVLRPIVRMWLVMVLHVNADDAESVVHAMQFALDFKCSLVVMYLSTY
jgi:2-oxoglutarate dehydrogenase complex dehydrogenase (E1) component-like enzyme